MRIAVMLLAVAIASCGGGSAPSAPSPPSNPYTFTFTPSGVSPKELSVPAGSRVQFVNNDSRPHDVASDPHPEHTDCSEINAVGLLTQGQSRETGNLVTVRTCGFHDHGNPPATQAAGNIWTGRIIVR